MLTSPTGRRRPDGDPPEAWGMRPGKPTPSQAFRLTLPLAGFFELQGVILCVTVVTETPDRLADRLDAEFIELEPFTQKMESSSLDDEWLHDGD